MEYAGYQRLLARGTIVATFRPERGAAGGYTIRIVHFDRDPVRLETDSPDFDQSTINAGIERNRRYSSSQRDFMTRILITGGKGMLGRDLANQASGIAGLDVRARGRDELDVRDRDAVLAERDWIAGGWILALRRVRRRRRLRPGSQ